MPKISNTIKRNLRQAKKISFQNLSDMGHAISNSDSIQNAGKKTLKILKESQPYLPKFLSTQIGYITELLESPSPTVWASPNHIVPKSTESKHPLESHWNPNGISNAASLTSTSIETAPESSNSRTENTQPHQIKPNTQEKSRSKRVSTQLQTATTPQKRPAQVNTLSTTSIDEIKSKDSKQKQVAHPQKTNTTTSSKKKRKSARLKAL